MAATDDLAIEDKASQGPGRDAKVFVRDQSSLQTIRGALADIGIKDPLLQLGDVQTAAVVLAKTSSPRLLIVDIDGVNDPIADLNNLANVCDPNVNVIAVGARNDVVLYRDLKNIGVAEYFVKPIVMNVATRICRSVLDPSIEQPRVRTGKLILVIGVHGGVGATTIAIHTAWHLSETGRRRVALLDLDMKHGDLALQFDILPSNALCEAVEFPERVDKLFLNRAVQPISDRLDLLASLASLTENTSVTVEGVAPLLEQLATQYRYVIVDLPRHLAGEIVHSTLLPRICLLISDTSLSSARNVNRWRERIGANILERSTLHVVNRPSPNGGLSDRDFARATVQPPEVSIPHHRELAEAASFGIKGTLKCAGFTRSLQSILRPLTGEQAEIQAPFYRRIWG